MTRAAWHSFYSLETGLFVDLVVGGVDAAWLASNTPEGCRAIVGRFDPLSQRVDLATGQVVDWQPPKPPDDAERVWTWRADARRWVASPTTAAEVSARRAEIVSRIAVLEAQQARPVRELLIDPQNAAARARLDSLEAQITELRASIGAPA